MKKLESTVRSASSKSHAGNDQAHRAGVVEFRSRDTPPVDREPRSTTPTTSNGPGNEALLERDPPAKSLDALVEQRETLANCEHLGEDGEEDGLIPADHRQTGDEQRCASNVTPNTSTPGIATA